MIDHLIQGIVLAALSRLLKKSLALGDKA